jgi:hypothetical protein
LLLNRNLTGDEYTLSPPEAVEYHRPWRWRWIRYRRQPARDWTLKRADHHAVDMRGAESGKHKRHAKVGRC